MSDARFSAPQGLRTRLRARLGALARAVVQPRSVTLLSLAPEEVAQRLGETKQ
jgi:hypothetical protein